MDGKKGSGKTILMIIAIVVIVLLLGLSYFSFFYLKKVDSQTDFNKKLYNCIRTSYLGEQESAVWQYKIFGEKNSACRVEVLLVSVKDGVSDIKGLEGMSMICNVPIGSTNSPESNLKLCHGMLKEGIQEVIIERMHAYVTSNLDAISGVL